MQEDQAHAQSFHAPATFNLETLFHAPAQIARANETIGELIQTQTPPTLAVLHTHVKESLSTLDSTKFKPCPIKVPPQASAAPWLAPARKQIHDFIYFTLNLIVKQTKLVNRLSAHFSANTYPTEYRSIKMPNICIGGHELHRGFLARRDALVENLKATMLRDQLETETTFLNGLKLAMSPPVVAETYKSLASELYQRQTACTFTAWSDLAHILIDYDVILKMTSKEVNLRARMEQEKAEKLQAAQAAAATADASMPVRDLVKKVVMEEISALPKKPSQKPAAKNSSKKGPPPKNSGSKSAKSGPKKSPVSAKSVKRSKPKSGKKPPPSKHLKGSPPMGSKSTSYRKKTGGKN